MRQELNFNETPNCAVGKSSICGQGLFTLIYLFEGQIVIDYSNTKWPCIPFSELPLWNREFHWWVGVDQHSCFIPGPESTFMRANHSRIPNLLWQPDRKILTAKRDIRSGTELTYDYRLETASDIIKNNLPPWA